ncbi:fatty acid synthase alpha subunit Lsd1, partial [Coemansia helicoidea]
MLWKELDDTVFSLPRDKRLPALLAKKDYIIKRLNDDFQKPWFGQKADGAPADLEDMTYAEVATRLLAVLYVTHQSRWIDVTMRNLVGDYLLRLEERFSTSEGPAMLQSFDQLNEPFAQVEAVLDAYPESRTQLLATEDVQFFINLCLRPGQKPVPFIPLMDKDFHIWFKKDSLWQAEDVDAVAGQDVGRVCILQGPVAVRYATKANEPVKEILDNIYHGQIAALLARYYDGDEANVPAQGYLGDVPAARAVPAHVAAESTAGERVYTLSAAAAQLPGDDEWLETLAGSELTWLRALLMTPVVAQDRRYTSNVVRRVLRPRAGQTVRVALEGGRPRALAVTDACGARALDIALDGDESTIRFNMYSAPRGSACQLELLFRYRAAMPYAPIHEVMEGRNERIKRFYAQVWLADSAEATEIIAQAGPGGQVHRGRAASTDQASIRDFSHAIGNVADGHAAAGGASAVAPLDYAIRAFWPALCKCLMSPVCDGDLTSLVHLSNEFRVVPGTLPMGPGQQLASEAQIVEVTDGASGRTIRVTGHVTRAGKPVVAVDTSFLFRGHAAEYGCNFKHAREPPLELVIADTAQLALLQSREWFVPAEGAQPLVAVGTTLRFDLESRYTYKSATVHAHVMTCGAVLARGPSAGWTRVADVDYEGADCYGSVVMRFLRRHGRPAGTRSQQFSSGRDLVPAGSAHMAAVRAPDNNQRYSDASTDHNPIHTSV